CNGSYSCRDPAAAPRGSAGPASSVIAPPTLLQRGEQGTHRRIKKGGDWPGGSAFGLRLEHLPAAIHAGLQVDVVRTAQFARILVIHIGRTLERIGRTA